MPDQVMQDVSSDTVRAEMLRAAADALSRTAPALPPAAAAFIGRLHAGLPTAELAQLTPEAMAGAAASLWSLALHRRPGEVLVRVTGPGQAGSPALPGAAVAEIVTDDMSFLVDSAVAALTQAGHAVRQLMHPVVPVRRDTDGRLLGWTGAWEAGAILESWMRIDLGAAIRHPAAAGREPGHGGADLDAMLRRVLDDVRAANADYHAMRTLVGRAAVEIGGQAPGQQAPGQQAPGGQAPGVAPTAAFLDWLVDDNFVLLGHRRIEVGADGALSVAPAENLGVLRRPDIAAFDALADLNAIPPAVRAALLEPLPLVVAKANLLSTVHRAQHGDAVITRIFGGGGAVVGVRVFFGLFAATAYTRNPRSIPMLAEKVGGILATSGVDPNSHDGRALRSTLDTWPRDELFQAPASAILDGARRALDLRLRPRTALVVRLDPFERFVSAIAWLPREVFDTRLREAVGGILARAYAGRISAHYVALGDEPLARVNYIIGTTPGAVPDVDVAVLEQVVRQAARDFRDRLAEAVTDAEGEAAAARLLARWGDAFPAAYRDAATAAQGAADLALAEHAAATGRAATRLEQAPGAAPDALTLRLAQPGASLPLADILPLLESLDLRAMEEVPYYLTSADAGQVVLQVFALRSGAEAPPARFAALLEALDALLDGRAEADGFNRLVLRAGLTWRECWLLRAMHRWTKQVGAGFSQASVEATLAAHPDAARILVDLFHARFAPDRADRDEAALEAAWTALLDGVANPDEDRILTRLLLLLRAVLRTNFHADAAYIALKLDSAAAGDMPLPRPWREIFVHSARMEGCHLRAGPVARGGIRWSDRREDFRTEILGLMKAQRLKNVVIVPTGAKGGFVLKQAPAGREALMAEGVGCYSILINAMLDMADNLDGARAATPPGIVRRDEDDPYMVAAADKGTATFSDIANGIAVGRGFWLGDAFASGGSQGYDHKAMGITAKGAWVMVARHFAELGLDIQADPFTCVGVGDMSGDVFGNGLLVSRQTRLLAAFDHRHIFIDPDPGPDAYDERTRLFALPRSSWMDYDPALISPGGGVFSRGDKRILLPVAAAVVLGLPAGPHEPAVVMQAILRAPADLLYFGGIGTYVKATTETQAEAGDRTNDALRIDGAEVRARVLAEGANLAITQAGRIEYARSGAGGVGGQVNTDALDNSAGVSTSDHEVNIKILLADAERDGMLTRRGRDDLLAAMTAEVGAQVLRDNHQQSLAVSLEVRADAAELPAHAALMDRLEAEGVLDRAVSGLPGAAAMTARGTAGNALLRPEVAALLPVAKLWLTEAVEGAHDLLDDPAFEPLLLRYFPAQLRDGFARLARRHRLRRELVATVVVNEVANRLGPAALGRLSGEAGPKDAGPVAVVRAAWLAGALFDLDPLCDAIDAAPASAAVRLDALLTVRRLHEEVTRALLGGTELDQPLGAAVAALRPGIAVLAALASEDAASGAAALALRDAGLPGKLAAQVAAAPRLATAPAVVRLATRDGAPLADAAAVWARVGRTLGIEELREAVVALAVRGPFGARAKAALLADLMQAQTALAGAVLRASDPAGQPEAAAALQLARQAAAAPDLAGLGLATRAIRSLA